MLARLRPFLQEYNAAELAVEADAAVIIERGLEHGDVEFQRWLLSTYGEARLRAFVRAHGARRLSPRAFAYWQVVLEVDDAAPHPFGETARLLWGNHRMLEAPTQREGLPLAGTADIAAMKLSAIIGRGSRKDFIDLDALLTERPLADWMTAAERKFDTVPEFRRMALRALLYFDDADVEQAPRMLRPLDWEALKAWLRRDVGELGRADLGVAS